MQLDGSVKIGSIPVINFKSHNFGYMYQHNLFCGVLTVKEHLYFMVNTKFLFIYFFLYCMKTIKITYNYFPGEIETG